MLKLTNQKILLLGIIFAILRLTNLQNFPIFGDEALYLYLSDNFLKNPQTYLTSIQYGVMPIFIWIQSLLFFINQDKFNLLILGRALNVIIDLSSAYLIFFITKKLFDQKSAILAFIVYLILPINFLHSRLILLESLTNFFILSSIYLHLNLLINIKITSKEFLILIYISLLTTLSYFTKPISIISFPALFSIPLVVIFSKKLFTFKKIQSLITNWLIFLISTGFLISIFYLPISEEFTTRYITKDESLFISLKENIWKIIWWSKTYFTLPLIITTLIALLFGLFKKNYSILWLGFWIFSALFLSAITAANFYPRHLFLIAAPFAILVGYILNKILKYIYVGTLLVIAFLIYPAANLNIQIITNPPNAPIALEDRQQYFEDWSSGVGIDQVAEYFTFISRNKQITVYVENEPSQYWVLTNLYKIPNTKIIPSKNLFIGLYLEESLTPQITENSYIVFNKNPYPSTDWPIQKVTSLPKGPNREITIYKIKN